LRVLRDLRFHFRLGQTAPWVIAGGFAGINESARLRPQYNQMEPQNTPNTQMDTDEGGVDPSPNESSAAP
jgi:hypothetical protein